MNIDVMNCPNCGYPLPKRVRDNQLLKCGSCGSTLYISNWRIGDASAGVVVATPTRVYTVTDLLRKDDLCNVYRCLYEADARKWEGIFRIARGPNDNDLVSSEGSTLYHFQATSNYDDFRPFIPTALESFLYNDTGSGELHQVNIFGLHEKINSPDEFYTLEEIHNYYSGGINPKDMAWMWRRLLNILGFVHQHDVVHGAILPPHVLIEPKDHKLLLDGWGFSVRDPRKTGKRLKAVSVSYEDWYPQEVFDKKTPTPGLDILMGARCMMYLIGANPLGDPAHRNLDPVLQKYFARCLESNPNKRPQDAWKLLDEFDKLIEKLWGPRQFHVFTMPAKS